MKKKFLNVLFVLEREREREREHECGRGRERGRGERIPNRLHALSAKPDWRLELTNPEIVTGAEKGSPCLSAIRAAFPRHRCAT